MSVIVEIENNVNTEKEVDKLSSSSKKKGGSTKVYESESENLSISDLDLIANKRKLAKKSTDRTESELTKKSSSKGSVKVEKKSRSGASENDNPQIRREKSDYLYKLEKLNATGKFSSYRFDMNTPLSEIRNEYDRIKNSLENERSVKFLQRMMLLMIQGVEMLNTKFDPLGIDLDGWGESMAYSLETQEYDEVLSELYEKYKSVGNMSPEVKLLFMIISSASMFAITKKLTKNETNIGNLLTNLMGKSGGGDNGTTNMNTTTRKFDDLKTDTTEDLQPSKLNGPDDNISIGDILQKMNAQRQSKRDEEVVLDIDIDQKTEDVFKNITIQPPQKKRGRPAKGRKGISPSLNF